MTTAAVKKLTQGLQGPVLVIVAHLGEWGVWLDVFEIIYAGWVLNLTFWTTWLSAPYPLQLELWSEAI